MNSIFVWWVQHANSDLTGFANSLSLYRDLEPPQTDQVQAATIVSHLDKLRSWYLPKFSILTLIEKGIMDGWSMTIIE